jgi:hypothetical protein
MVKHIDVERRFASTNEQSLSDPDYLSYFSELPEGVKNWEDVLKASPTVILAEGRCGKTYEFQRQVRQLQAEGKYAFFVPLERLHDEEFADALEAADIDAFNAWRASPSDDSFFFLDALDELKLRDGTLRKAVKSVAKAIQPHTHRASVIVSCRPSDWKSHIDHQELRVFCASKEPKTAAVSEDAEAVFLSIVSKDEYADDAKDTYSDQGDSVNRSDLQILTLLPLSKPEIKAFAEKHSPQHATAFQSHIEDNDLWHLYRLPVEIMDCLDQIEEGQNLGRLDDQVSYGVRKRLSETSDGKRQSLSLEQATEGSERLALALYLLKRRSLKTEETDDQQALGVPDILTDWSPDEQKELIGRPLFDPSGVGAVRFHHRSSQEYLAASRLKKLYEAGMPHREFLEVLFSEVGAEKVVKPSMAPIAAWLSLWLSEVRKQVLQRQPELLFRQGLPSALPIELKREILIAYVQKYADKDWCRTGVDPDNLRRVASPELGDTVRELWSHGYTGHDSRELLLDFIWAGKIASCVDLAVEALSDNNIGSRHQLYAAWGICAAGTDEQKRQLVEAIVSRKIDERIVRSVLPDLVPASIPIDQACVVIDNLNEVPRTVHGVNYTIYQIAKRSDLTRAELIALRDHLANTIWNERSDDCKIYQTRSAKDHYQDGLIAACRQTIPDCADEYEDWARAVAIAEHFGERDHSIIAKTETEEIWKAIRSNTSLRESYFWACVKIADDIEGKEDDWGRFIRSISDLRRTTNLGEDDKDWLLTYLSRSPVSENRGVTFEAVKYFFDLKNDKDFAKAVSKAIEDRDDWKEQLSAILNREPREPDEYEIRMQKRQKKHQRKERKRVADWKKWRAEVLADPDFLMGTDKRLGVLYDAQKVISQGTDRNGNWGHWDSGIIKNTFGTDFLARYRKELGVFWRETEVELPSERPKEKRNSYYNNWLLALAAVKAEAELQGWAAKLSADEAVRAARVSCIELNGFGSFYRELDAAHPNAFRDVIAKEASAQLERLAETGDSGIFHDVHFQGTANMKSALASAIAPRLDNFTYAEGESSKNALEYAIRVISSHGSQSDIEQAIAAVSASDRSNHPWPAFFRLSALAILDPEKGCRELLREIRELKTPKQRSYAVSAFVAVFGNGRDRPTVDLNAIPVEKRIPLVRDLVIRAYQAIRRDEDTNRADGGVYTPNERDNAQDARSYLFETLLSVKQPGVLSIIHELAEAPEFAHMPDRLRQMAYELAAEISDTAAYTLDAFKSLDREGAFVPHDDRSLFTAMMTRLDAFEHDLLHADDSPVDILRKADQETELRRFIANWLRNNDRGVFDFTQEAVAKDERRTDVRLHPKSLNHRYAAIEVKRETWSLSELEKALTDQLVGRYLRHKNCQVGCLLICQRQSKMWHNPNGGAQWNLTDLVSYLQSVADRITADRPEFHIAVKGIDYSN